MAKIAEELGELTPRWTETARLAFHRDTLVGLAFVVIDNEQDRAWINGPWVVAEHGESVAKLVVERLLDKVVPAGIKDVEFLGHVEHRRLERLAQRQPGPDGYIHFVGVDTDHRRPGTGRSLEMAAVVEMLADPAASQVFLSVDSTNPDPLALYRPLGFWTEPAMVGFRTPAGQRRQLPEPSGGVQSGLRSRPQGSPTEDECVSDIVVPIGPGTTTEPGLDRAISRDVGS